jgi:hypothetical protein
VKVLKIFWRVREDERVPKILFGDNGELKPQFDDDVDGLRIWSNPFRVGEDSDDFNPGKLGPSWTCHPRNPGL